jgi:threonine/homoserine/homoserine lactone efflux protein
MLVALILATVVLVAIPGPNVALIVANVLRRGFRIGLLTVLGTTAGVAVQLALVVLGLATLLHYAADIVVWVKWLGVAYLIYLGVRTWRDKANALDLEKANLRPASLLFWEGFGLAVINPKTLLFNAAFLPQFAGDSADGATLFALSITYVLVLFAGDVIWAASAHNARKIIERIGRMRSRLTGGLLIASGLGLAAARVRD